MSKLKYYDGTEWKTVNGQITGDTLPIGAIIPYSNSTAPTNWLVCDGSAVSRTTYANLFSVIGTTYGSGDGSTTFNLPNLKGRVAVGQDTNDTDFDTLGETGGSKELQKHTHNILRKYTGAGFETPYSEDMSGWGLGENAGAVLNSTSETGTGNSGNLQPYQVVCYIIKANQSAGVVAQVENTQSNSQVDTYSCDYSNNHFELKGTILYDNSTGTTSNITLSDSANNYDYLEIYYKTNDSGSASSQKITGMSSGTKIASLSYIWFVQGSYYFKQANVNINGTSITFSNNNQWENNAPIEGGNFIYITRVVGYK